VKGVTHAMENGANLEQKIRNRGTLRVPKKANPVYVKGGRRGERGEVIRCPANKMPPHNAKVAQRRQKETINLSFLGIKRKGRRPTRRSLL